MNAVDAEPPGGFGICGVVIDVDRALRIDGEAGKHKRVNPRIRLSRADFARDENSAEPGEEFKTLERNGKGFGRPVREAIERRAPQSRNSARISTVPAIGPAIIS